ncbi:hypothetical protein CYMTET_51743 [Cymbomonas tetramitiformis]|uniref:Tyrosine-protein kinase ephrin type A/B receptor-like domain-containing protein n=1 Tax=Cymbomonas tetramitiformis TaxID=36881 RepID=A0AAE0BKN3_9CHLO|nr:hypothetical protein CYMTET_51743 [Cymbomonas tetramitiformis]
MILCPTKWSSVFILACAFCQEVIGLHPDALRPPISPPPHMSYPPPQPKPPPQKVWASGRAYECPQGKYLNKYKCLDCPWGRTTPGGGSISPTECTECCSAGQFMTSAFGMHCITCPAATYSVDCSGSCMPCAPGTTTEYPGAAACEMCCEAGQIMTNQLYGTCEDCPRGQFSSNCSTECAACPEGTTSILGSSECNVCCAAGEYMADQGTAKCEKCPAGTFSDPCSTKCTPCPKGAQSNAGSGTCDLCCPLGQYLAPQSHAGAIQCLGCPAGEFSNSTCASSCQKCPPGVSSKLGSASCTLCCDAGQYMRPSTVKALFHGRAQRDTVPRRIETYQLQLPLAREVLTRHCGVLALRGSCTALRGSCGTAGFLRHCGVLARHCAGFLHGTAGLLHGTAGLLHGTAGLLNGTASPGSQYPSYQTVQAMTALFARAGGFVNPRTCQTECKECPQGEFAPAGAKWCQKCLPGSSTSRAGADHCDVTCPEGTYGSLQGLCHPCPANTYSATRMALNASACKACPPGLSSAPRSTSKDQCKPCPAGTFMNERGECTQCDPGTFLHPLAEGGALPSGVRIPVDVSVDSTGARTVVPENPCAPCPKGHTSAPGAQANTHCYKDWFVYHEHYSEAARRGGTVSEMLTAFGVILGFAAMLVTIIGIVQVGGPAALVTQAITQLRHTYLDLEKQLKLYE